MKNKLVVFEGIDGSGKSSTSRLLKDELLAKGISAVCFEDIEDKNNGFNKLKKFIKSEATIESSLFFYIASSIYKSKLIKELLKTQWVICDRYVFSTIAYHLAKGINPKLIPYLNKTSILLPDHFILLKTEETVRLKRLKTRPDTTSEDLTPKTPGSFFDQMEQSFESYKPTIIDNTNINIHETIDQILKILKI